MSGANATVLESEDDFHDAVRDRPTLLNFSAAWIRGCQDIAPVFNAFAHEMAGSLNVLKIEVDQHQAMVERFGIDRAPTMLIFKQSDDPENAEPVDKRVGIVSTKEQLKAFVRQALTP